MPDPDGSDPAVTIDVTHSLKPASQTSHPGRSESLCGLIAAHAEQAGDQPTALSVTSESTRTPKGVLRSHALVRADECSGGPLTRGASTTGRAEGGVAACV